MEKPLGTSALFTLPGTVNAGVVRGHVDGKRKKKRNLKDFIRVSKCFPIVCLEVMIQMNGLINTWRKSVCQFTLDSDNIVCRLLAVCTSNK